MRHIQSLLFLTSILIGYLARAHLGVSIVAMTYYVPITNKTYSNNITFHLNKSQHPNYDHELNNITNIVINNYNDTQFIDDLVSREMENVTSDENGIYKVIKN